MLTKAPHITQGQRGRPDARKDRLWELAVFFFLLKADDRTP